MDFKNMISGFLLD